jgi:hypothetical protein
VSYARKADIDSARPAGEEKYERIVGIRDSYQYRIIGASSVAVRTYSCWCSACLSSFLIGPASLYSNGSFVLGMPVEARYRGNQTYFTGTITAVNTDGTLYIDYDDGDKESSVPPSLAKSRPCTMGCCRSSDPLHQWRRENCARLTGRGVAASRAAARDAGNGYAQALNAGDWCLFEHRLCSGDRGLEIWLGKAIAMEEWSGKPSKMADVGKGKRRTIHGNRYDHGEYMVAVQWHERVVGDSDQLEFEVGAADICIQNSATLRLASFTPETINHPAIAGSSSASTTWRIAPDDMQKAMDACV